MSQSPPSRRKRTLAVLIVAVIVILVLFDLFGGNIPTGPTTSTTTGQNNFEFFKLPNNPLTTTQTSTGGNASVQGLNQALNGQSGFNAFLSARQCSLVITQTVLFCDTFPDNQLDAQKWVSVGNVTVTPGNVRFHNATIRTSQAFYYGKFATFQIEINPPGNPQQAGCPGGYIYSLARHACVYDYAVWGFARGVDANHIQTGMYWEQNITSIRTHTRAQNGFTGAYVDLVSAWQPVPRGIVDYGINWNVDFTHGGAYAQFVYHVRGSSQIVYFSLHTGPSIPQLTPLYLFAASNGTFFVLHRVIILPAWINGQAPFVNLP